MNFQRGKDPKKSMDIGVKVYRCGHCGTICREDGTPLNAGDEKDTEEFQKAKEILDQIGDSKTELIQGDCCAPQDPNLSRMRVTHDMALDAEDLSLEGTFI
jgi:hypothetical protein